MVKGESRNKDGGKQRRGGIREETGRESGKESYYGNFMKWGCLVTLWGKIFFYQSFIWKF